MVKIEAPCGCIFYHHIKIPKSSTMSGLIFEYDPTSAEKICNKHREEALEESYQEALEENNKTIRKIKEQYAEMRFKQ